MNRQTTKIYREKIQDSMGNYVNYVPNEAVHAYRDRNGKDIVDTYATKVEMEGSVALLQPKAVVVPTLDMVPKVPGQMAIVGPSPDSFGDLEDMFLNYLTPADGKVLEDNVAVALDLKGKEIVNEVKDLLRGYDDAAIRYADADAETLESAKVYSDRNDATVLAASKNYADGKVGTFRSEFEGYKTSIDGKVAGFDKAVQDIYTMANTTKTYVEGQISKIRSDLGIVDRDSDDNDARHDRDIQALKDRLGAMTVKRTGSAPTGDVLNALGDN